MTNQSPTPNYALPSITQLTIPPSSKALFLLGDVLFFALAGCVIAQDDYTRAREQAQSLIKEHYTDSLPPRWLQALSAITPETGDEVAKIVLLLFCQEYATENQL